MAQQSQQPTPEQQRQVKKAKAILWIGIVGIVVIGMAVAVYFVFLKEATNTVGNNENANTNQNVNQISESTIDVLEALADPAIYHNQEVCLTGYYQSSFEFSAMGATYTEDEYGWSYLEHQPDNSDLVWINVDTPRYECPIYNNRGCVQEMTLCGVFKIKGENKGVGFGHLGAYQYALDPASTVSNGCTWEAGNCRRIISSGYYYNNQTNTCDFFDRGYGCSNPPYSSLEECEETCIDTTINSNTNSSTTNTNTISVKNCNDINTLTECKARTDCLPVDLCDCVTDEYWYTRCSIEGYDSCVCVQGGFKLCADLDCSEEPISRQLLCGWEPLDGQACDEMAISGYYYNNAQNKCEKTYLRGPECSSAPFYSLENCQSACGDKIRKYCQSSDDCGLLECGGCYSQDYLEDAPPDLPCRMYAEGYECQCVDNACTETEIE